MGKHGAGMRLPPAPGPAGDGINRAVDQLGWSGVALPPSRVLGNLVIGVVEIDLEAHRVRARDGAGAELDGDTLAIWEWPESRSPDSVVRLCGVLVPMMRSFGQALAVARGWRAFGPSSVLVPDSVITDEVCRWECDLHGVGLIGMTGPQMVPAQRGRLATSRRRAMDRWLEEQFYDIAISAGFVAV